MTRAKPEYFIHLVCGSTGAGKSAYALELCGEIGAVLLSIDEWMVTLFWDDSPDPIEFEWTMERVNRCETEMWAMAQQITGYGFPVVLDLGFTTGDHRKKFARLAKESGLSVQLHFLDLPRGERWKRVQARNAAKDNAKKKGKAKSKSPEKHGGKAFQLEVDRETFNFVEDMWEPPTDAETKALNGVRVTE